MSYHIIDSEGTIVREHVVSLFVAVATACEIYGEGSRVVSHNGLEFTVLPEHCEHSKLYYRRYS